MKVALLAPITWRVPPRAYGPWEQIVSLLAEGLVERGVEVTLFASLDSVTTAELDGTSAEPYGEHPELDGRIAEALHVAHALDRSGEFDLVHNNLDWLPLAFAAQSRAPLLTTVHGFSSSAILPAYLEAVRHGAAFVSISDSDRDARLPYLATVHHGIDLALTPFVERSEGSLVVFGRIHPDKGTADAIEIARRAGLPLAIAGPVHDESYFRERVAPELDDDRVRYLGNIGPEARASVLGSAAALLHPIGFDEPFGLSVVEAMSCGTPVIAFDRGSMREVVDVGVTGFLARDVADAVALVPRALALDRARVHEVAASRFSSDRMVDDYLDLYRRMTGGAAS